MTMPAKTKDYGKKIDPITLDHLKEYENELKVAQLSDHTIRQYMAVLYKVFAEIGKALDQLNYDDVFNWLGKHPKWKKTSLYNRQSVLSTFFDFCEGQGYMSKNLIKKNWRTQLPKGMPKALNDYEYAQLRIAMSQCSLRDRSILELLDTTGMRREELLRLNVGDVQSKDRSIKVLGKGNKERLVQFSEQADYYLEKYCQGRPKEDPLFLNRDGNRLGVQGLYRICVNVGKKAEITRSLSPHVLRHTFATRRLQAGDTMSEVGDKLGHEDPDTTKGYAAILQSDVVMFYDKAQVR